MTYLHVGTALSVVMAHEDGPRRSVV